MCSCKLFSVPQGEGQGIHWMTNYEEAVQQSKSLSKPVVLFFTGSDWCGWCTKLDEEALGTREFADAAAAKFIFVKLDFPLYAPQDLKLKAQNKQLQDKFSIRSFPTILILDPQQNQQIGTTGYRPGGGKAFADYLIKMVNDYSGYKQKMSMIDQTKLSGTELKKLYAKSVGLQLKNDTGTIMEKGVSSNESVFFLTEQYRLLANSGKIHDKKAVALREQLLSVDPNNEKLTQYQLALIDFQAYSSEMVNDQCNSECAIAPLISYINKYGEKDRENPWRLKFIISQVYLDKNEMPSALKYAQESYDSAPASVRPEIGLAIHNIRSQIHSSL
ncbi:MAG: thioredoxin family protein [Parachlamydiaceae bacterium]